MSDFKYTPDKEQKVHKQGAISLICKPYQSHQNGLPEWCKNAADAYGREDAPPERRAIILLFSDRKALGSPSIACLDFVGATSGDIEKYFRQWADPDAAKQNAKSKVQGGHGNGGKCYMTQMFEEYAVFHTVRDNKGCRYGVEGGSTRFGYVPNENKGRDYEVRDRAAELNQLLKEMGASSTCLPDKAQEALKIGAGFTLVKGVKPRYYDSRISVKDLISQVRDHSQMLTTLEYCDVYVISNGRLLRDCNPLKPSDIEPMSGEDKPRIINIPEKLEDPLDNKPYSTTNDGSCSPGHLELLSSSKSMRWSKKYRHTINYKALGGFIGFKEIPDFSVRSSYQDQIYGECSLDALEQYKQNDRHRLADAPLVRAVQEFIRKKIEAYAEEFERRDRKTYSKRERNELSRINEALDRWKNQFIKNFVQGAFGSAGGGGSSSRMLPSGKASQIEVSCTCSRLGVGVAIRPQIRFFDSAGRQIRPTAYRWISEDNNVALVDDDLMLINSFAPGGTYIWAETSDGSLKSNRVPLQVVRIWSIRIEPAQVQLSTGSRLRMKGICKLANKEEADDVALIWTEANPSIARVSSSGVVFGASEGRTEVIAGDDRILSDSPSTVTVIESEGPAAGKGSGGKGAGKNLGRGYPQILVSGYNSDPESGEPLVLSSDHPPIYQRPQDTDRNIWWINSSSPLARMYLSKENAYGYESREWRMYHLERYIEIMAEIALSFDPRLTGEMTVREYSMERSDKLLEIHNAAAAELNEFITDGVLPKG
ncbi:MAG: hypothetical protein H8E73_05460 [Planctomycetes bacterium]|nr:hypothetical protein [Planctomycetota bacterium]